MTATPRSIARLRLSRLAAHIVVALIALVVVGGATRVMEAGLACPDWPLCFGVLLPGRQMNIQVFLEWFHRLDAFFVGIALLVQFFLTLFWKSHLPRWVMWISISMVLLVALQGVLGALTVLQLLPSDIVTAHLTLALTLVALMSGLSQRLHSVHSSASPSWWRFMSGTSLVAVMGQCVLGARMATSWSAKRCIAFGDACFWLDLHRTSAIVVSLIVLTFVVTAVLAGGWPRSQWPYLVFISLLITLQVSLGILSMRFELSEPLITIGHQLVATLLVAYLALLSCSQPTLTSSEETQMVEKTFFNSCNG